MFNINVELTAKCIKSLADNNRCMTCDKLSTPCARYPCGHAACTECVAVAECCLLCITPPPQITHYNDEVLSRRVENATQLVVAYQELFGEDVNKRVSLSKQQKIEKLLFPECIQASNKYFNKRKSSTSVLNGKEHMKQNILLPGEQTTNRSLKMENKHSYVQQWLNNIQSPLTSKTQRKPFADLNVSNIQNTVTMERQTRTYGKRKHYKTTCNNAENVVPIKKCKNVVSSKGKHKQNEQKESFIMPKAKKHEVDESGIGMDDDVIEILDSQEVTDKDKLAFEAVKEADLDKDDICIDLFNDSSFIEQSVQKVCKTPNKSTKTYKVPFYKKGFLFHTFDCHCSCKTETNNTKFRNVSITIENNSFLTTINVSDASCNFKNTVAGNNNPYIATCKSNKEVSEEAPKYLDTRNGKNKCNSLNINSNTESNTRNDNLRKGVTISDSDSDSTLGFIDEKVAVEVHRSCNEMDYTVLSELDFNQCNSRARHARRENTPLSTDSSDKENFDPNRMKKKKDDKKCCPKKIFNS